MIGRRGFITGLVSLVAAPAIVRVASIMPVKVIEPLTTVRIAFPPATWRLINEGYSRGPLTDILPLLRFEQKQQRITLEEYARIHVERG